MTLLDLKLHSLNNIEQCCQLRKQVHIVGTTDSFDIFPTFRNFQLIQNKPALIELE